MEYDIKFRSADDSDLGFDALAYEADNPLDAVRCAWDEDERHYFASDIIDSFTDEDLRPVQNIEVCVYESEELGVEKDLWEKQLATIVFALPRPYHALDVDLEDNLPYWMDCTLISEDYYGGPEPNKY